MPNLRVAIVHDYLNQQGGAEKVVEVFCGMFPDAPVYTSVYDRHAMGPFWREVDIRTSFMQHISPRFAVARTLLPLYPFAFESFDLSGYDLVLSSASTFAKGVKTKAGTVHVCYCYTPARYAWMYEEYVARQNLPAGARRLLPAVIAPLKRWDYKAAQRPDRIIAISYAVTDRIRRFYGRESEVIEPPVDIAQFSIAESVGDHYLVVARLAAYKRIDLAVEACTRLGLPLRVVGDGPHREALEGIAGPTVEFLGRVDDAEVRRLMSSCRAVLWPGEEDFGLVPVEAQASGRPVMAYRAGGALETVVDGVTGVLFSPQTVDALVEALNRFQNISFEPAAARKNAERFDLPIFVERMRAVVEAALSSA